MVPYGLYSPDRCCRLILPGLGDKPRQLANSSPWFLRMVISRRVFLQASAGLLPWQRLHPITMQLDWHLNAQFAGLCIAQHQGFYRRQGLAVTLNAATPEMDVVQTVVTQPWTIGCAEESLILEAQAQGVEVVAIASMLQSSPLAIMSLPEQNLNTPKQLITKRIGVHNDGRKALELVLNLCHIDPKQLTLVDIPYINKHQRLLDGEFDAVQCYALDEPIELAQRIGSPPSILALKDYGFDAYSQVLFAPVSLVQNQRQIIHQFLTATFSGWQWAMASPSQTAKILVAQYVEPDYQNLSYQIASLKGLADYIQPHHQTIGGIEPQRWQQSAQQLKQAGLIEHLPPLATSIDTGLWP